MKYNDPCILGMSNTVTKKLSLEESPGKVIRLPKQHMVTLGLLIILTETLHLHEGVLEEYPETSTGTEYNGTGSYVNWKKAYYTLAPQATLICFQI